LKPKQAHRTTIFETLASGAQGMDFQYDVLAFGAHPDDVEISMGGTLLALKNQGAKIAVCHLTDGEPTPLGTPALRRKEAARAASVLNLSTYRILSIRNRELQDTLSNRKQVAEVIRELRPRILFAPYWVDAHPDHWNASLLVESARFWAKLVKSNLKGDPWYPPKLYYHLCSHLRPNVQPSFIVDISAYQEKKMEAVRCYESQFIKKKGSQALQHVTIMNQYFGVLIGTRAGEPFFSKENLGIQDPRFFL
jgi:bacillithiol biosynthesis deacetylase BshB1